MNDRIINNLIRIGEVVDINPDNYTCQVYFEEQDFVSGELGIGISGGTRNRDHDLPNLGDQAVVLFFPPLLSDGIVICFRYNDEDLPVSNNQDVWCKVFPDGSKISYNTKTQVFDISSGSTININASKINLTGDVIINSKQWLQHQHAAGNLKDGDSKPVTGKSGDGSV